MQNLMVRRWQTPFITHGIQACNVELWLTSAAHVPLQRARHHRQVGVFWLLTQWNQTRFNKKATSVSLMGKAERIKMETMQNLMENRWEAFLTTTVTHDPQAYNPELQLYLPMPLQRERDIRARLELFCFVTHWNQTHFNKNASSMSPPERGKDKNGNIAKVDGEQVENSLLITNTTCDPQAYNLVTFVISSHVPLGIARHKRVWGYFVL